MLDNVCEFRSPGSGAGAGKAAAPASGERILDVMPGDRPQHLVGEFGIGRL